MTTPIYFLVQTLFACALLFLGTLDYGHICTFFLCAGSFILGHLVTEALNYNQTNEGA
jgi:hypothetical protein